MQIKVTWIFFWRVTFKVRFTSAACHTFLMGRSHIQYFDHHAHYYQFKQPVRWLRGQKTSLSSVQEYFDCPCWLRDIAGVFLSSRSDNVVKKIENINSNASFISVLFFSSKNIRFQKEGFNKTERYWVRCNGKLDEKSSVLVLPSIHLLSDMRFIEFWNKYPRWDYSIGRKAITRKWLKPYTPTGEA